MNRREFLIQTGATTAGCLVGGVLAARAGQGGSAATSAAARGVAIILEPADPIASARPAQWAADQLQQALTGRGVVAHRCASLDEAAPGELCLVAADGNSPMARAIGVPVLTDAEALAIAPGSLDARAVLLVLGSDSRGLTYALTDVADAVALGTDPWAALQPPHAVIERPANAVRSVMRAFASDVEDQPWFHDRDFWRRYLSMLAAQRFNRFNLALGLGYDSPNGLRDTYFYFAYPFLLAVPGYEVRATNLPDAERDRNLEMLRFISDETAARGMDFQLGLWTHAYQWVNSPDANHVIEGLTPQTHAPYCRDALALLLKECPSIAGVTFRIHGESGVPEGSYDLWRTIFDGCVRCGRRVAIDLHAKGMDQGTLDAALATGLPLTISPKFWAEHLGLPYHQAAIRPTELPKAVPHTGPFAQSEGARSFLRYGYGDLLAEDRRFDVVHRVWPGTQRVLLWGDPLFAAAYGRAMRFCGSRGCEFFEPLSFKGRKGSGLPGGRDGYADPALRAAGGGDFEKYLYTYRLWGRMLYDPAVAPETWQRQLRHDYGAAAGAAEKALAHASRLLPLVTTAHMPSAANNNYWPEMYVNQSIVDDAHPQPYTDTPSPKRFGAVSPLDPQLFARVDDFAEELLAGRVGGKYSPVEVAQWLEERAQTAADSLAQAAAATDHAAPAFRRLAIDVEVQIALGRFFAQKLRAGVLFALFERTGDPAAKEVAVAAYRAARQIWAHLAEVTAGVYVSDVTYGEGWFQRGHWSDRLAAIDRDIALMEQTAAAPAPPAVAPGVAPGKITALIREVLGRSQRPVQDAINVPPASFHRGQPVALQFEPRSDQTMPKTVQLYYRHLHQAQPWQTAPMKAKSGSYRAVIPGEYTDSPYPLEYYYELTDASGRSWLHPGLGPNLTDQPYFVLRQARAPGKPERR